MLFNMHCTIYSARKVGKFNGFVVSLSALKNKKLSLNPPLCGNHYRESLNLGNFLIRFTGKKPLSFSYWTVRQTGVADKEIQGSVQRKQSIFCSTIHTLLPSSLIPRAAQGKAAEEPLLIAELSAPFYLELGKRRDKAGAWSGSGHPAAAPRYGGVRKETQSQCFLHTTNSKLMAQDSPLVSLSI